MIPFYLVTGFLGSGKTTLLKNILNEYSESRRIAIIQNEFAPAGTDGKELKMTGNPFRLVEVNNGSVFCVCMLGTFIQSLEKLVQDYAPEMIILEASGLSDPINIIELLQDERIRNTVQLAKIFSIVDAPNFDRGLRSLPRFKHQVMIADVVMINKTDIYQGDIKLLHEKIRDLNPFGEITETSYCRFKPELFLAESLQMHAAAKAVAQKESEGRPPVNACVLRIHNKISFQGLSLFITKLQTECPRIKGHVNLQDGKVMAVQSVFERYETEEVSDYTGPTEIVAFGEKITPAELRKKFLEFATHD